MSARDVVESMVGGNHPPKVWRLALDALVAETRAESAVQPDGFEHLGSMKLTKSGDSWLIAAEWYGWLPGGYATREAAVMTFGYVLGGEQDGRLEELRDLIRRGESRDITVDDLCTWVRRNKPTDEEGEDE